MVAATPRGGEPGDVGRRDDLQVRDVVPAVGGAVRGRGGLERVERLAHRPVAQRVHVHLEAERVQPGDVHAQLAWVDEAQSPVAGRAAAPVQVGLQQGGGEVLDDAVLHDLDRGRGEAGSPGLRPPGHQLVDLLAAAAPVPPQRADHPGLQRSGLLGLQVDRQRVGLAEQRPDGGVLPGRDTVGEHHLLGHQQPGELVLGGGHRRQSLDEAGSPLVQGARRRARGVPLDPAVGRVRRRGVDAGELEGPAVGPGPVPVTVRQQGRPVGHDGVEHLARRRTAGEVRHRPARPEHPGLVRVRCQVGRDPGHRLGGRAGPGQVAAQHVDAGGERVRVRVLEPGDQEAAVQRHHLGAPAHQGAHVVVAGHRDDAAVAHGHRAAGRATAAEHRPADEDGVRGAHEDAANAFSRMPSPSSSRWSGITSGGSSRSTLP